MPKKEVPPLYPEPQPPAYAYAPPPAPPPEPWHYSAVQLLQDRNATVARVTVKQASNDYGMPADFEFIATGSSKREQGDKFNARTGELLALSRAYLNLSRQLYAAGRDLVEPEPVPEYLVPPEFAAGAQEYAAEPDEVPLQDPTDEDVELAKRILKDRVRFNQAVAALEDDEPEDPNYPTPDPRVVTAVEAFNGAADALNAAVSFLKTLTD